MKCARCADEGADRMEVQFRKGGRLILYLCAECADAERQDDDVSELVSSPAM